MTKRTIDVVASVLGLVILLPLILFTALLVAARLGRPVFFIQKRVGQGGIPFSLIKFRTMTSAMDRHGEVLPDDVRLTPLGRFLRSTSMDELPELVNVLRGEMSLVGPRPLLIDYLPLYNERQSRRHGVKPGLTGWAQINGRNSVDWDERLEMDVWYVENQSVLLDIKILFGTIAVVLRRQGIAQKGQATMGRFKGSAGTGNHR